MQKNGVSNLVFSNTAAVYDGTLGRPLKEDDPQIPNSVYGSTKRFLGQVLEQGLAFPNLCTTSLHYFNVYGAPESMVLREDHGLGSESHLIPKALQVAIYNLVTRFGLELPGFVSGPLAEIYQKEERTVLPVFGGKYDTPDGTCIRDYIGLETMIFFHLLAIKRLLAGGQEKNYEPFNLGTKTGNSVLSVINTAEQVVREVTGLPPLPENILKKMDDPERIIQVEITKPRPGDAAFLVADPGKANRELAHGAAVPGTNLRENIARAFWSMLYRPLGY